MTTGLGACRSGPSNSQGEDDNGPVIVLEVTGGIAGADERWEVFEDGRVEAVHLSQTRSTAPSEVDRILVTARRLGFFDYESTLLPDESCCDLITYTLTLATGDRSHSVALVDDQDAPDKLRELIAEVRQLTGAAP